MITTASAPVEVPTEADQSVETIELQLLLEGVYRRYGFDFRDYAFASLKRRIRDQMKVERLASISEYQSRLLHDKDALDRFLLGLSINENAMFRDPDFYFAFRMKVIPLLRTYPFIRIWNMGTCTGEEIYSMAIVLQEEGLYDRCRIYATDMNKSVIEKAREGIFPTSHLAEYSENYARAGGQRPFADYYAIHHGTAALSPDLKRNIVFALHNPVADRSFNEFHMIFCRNLMIYFNKSLQDHVHKLIYESLVMFGFLALGHRESLRLTAKEGFYDEIDAREKIYRKIR